MIRRGTSIKEIASVSNNPLRPNQPFLTIAKRMEYTKTVFEQNDSLLRLRLFVK